MVPTAFIIMLGIATIVGFYASHFPDVLNRHDFMWLTTLTAGVGALAMLIPDPLVAIAIAWIAVHPWWTFVGAINQILPDILRNGDTYRNLWPVGGWAALYILSGYLPPTGITILAYMWLGWATINALIICWQWKEGKPVPGSIIITEGRPPGALCGANWFCSYSLCVGVLSAVYLGGYYISIIPILAVSMIPAKHFTAPIAASIASLALLPDWWWRVATIAIMVLIFSYKLHRRHRATNLRYEMWLISGGLVWLSRFWGLGLGAYHRINLSDTTKEDSMSVYTNLHNDWLQSLIELGPIPVLCAVAELVRRTIWLPPTNEAHFALSLIILTAILATTYFPLHHPSQSLILAIAMGYRA